MNLDTVDICCNLLEIQYINNMKKILQLNEFKDLELREYLFPDEWSYIEDKDLKLQALKEALDKNLKLNETKLIRDYYKKL